MLYSHQIGAQFTLESYQKVSYLDFKSHTQFWIKDHENIRHINFPGTNHLFDWLTNLNFSLKELYLGSSLRSQIQDGYQAYFNRHKLISPYQKEGYKGPVKIHQGYYQAYLAIRPAIHKAVQETKLKIQINGHSSGGAIAQLAGTDINYHFKKLVDVVTFGSPKIGNKHWRKSANNRIVATNYINFLDPVPWLLFLNSSPGTNMYNKDLYWNPHAAVNYLGTRL